MLVEKPIELGDIVAVKLRSGEEVIGKLKAMNGERIIIIKPLVLGMQQSIIPSTGQPEIGMGFAPFMLALADGGSVTFDRDGITTYIKARKEISDAYIQSTSSIEVPQSSSLIV